MVLPQPTDASYIMRSCSTNSTSYIIQCQLSPTSYLMWSSSIFHRAYDVLCCHLTWHCNLCNVGIQPISYMSAYNPHHTVPFFKITSCIIRCCNHPVILCHTVHPFQSMIVPYSFLSSHGMQITLQLENVWWFKKLYTKDFKSKPFLFLFSISIHLLSMQADSNIVWSLFISPVSRDFAVTSWNSCVLNSAALSQAPLTFSWLSLQIAWQW